MLCELVGGYLGPPAICPCSPISFLGGGFHQNRLQEKVGTLTLTSLPEDLVNLLFANKWHFPSETDKPLNTLCRGPREMEAPAMVASGVLGIPSGCASLLVAGWLVKGAVTELGVSKVAFKEGAKEQLKMDFCEDVADVFFFLGGGGHSEEGPQG